MKKKNKKTKKKEKQRKMLITQSIYFLKLSETGYFLGYK